MRPRADGICGFELAQQFFKFFQRNIRLASCDGKQRLFPISVIRMNVEPFDSGCGVRVHLARIPNLDDSNFIAADEIRGILFNLEAALVAQSFFAQYERRTVSCEKKHEKGERKNEDKKARNGFNNRDF